MRSSIKLALLLTSGLQLVAWAPAMAQTSATPPGATPTVTAPPATEANRRNGPAADRDEESGTGDIIVTARRTDERLQDVPISITVFNNKQIAERNLVSPTDLVIYTPSLSATGIFGKDNTSYALRGFTQQNRTAASVAVYFADVVAPRSGPSIAAGDGAGPGQFLDLSNVQVLKGPQGTLFGRNTTGGAILLVPTKPTGRLEGYLEGLYGNYDWKGVQGVINTPLGDRARLRIAGEYQNRDGYTKNYGVGGNLDDRNYYAIRASLVVDLTANLENYLIASYSQSKTRGSAPSLLACNTGIANNLVNSPIATLACGNAATNQLTQQAANGTRSAASDVPGLNKRIQRGIINTTTWQASDTLTLKNIASYTELTSDLVSDVFGTNFKLPSVVPIPIFGAGGTIAAIVPTPTGPLAGTPIAFVDTFPRSGLHGIADQYTFTEELQLQGHTADNKLTYQGGAYFERSADLGTTGQYSTQLINCSNVQALQCTNYIGSLAAAVNQSAAERSLGLPAGSLTAAFASLRSSVGAVGQRLNTISFRNIGFYGQSTYAISDKLKLTGGIRYTIDRTSGTGSATNYSFGTPNVPVASCISANVRIATNSSCTQNFEEKSSRPTWLVGIDYKPSEDILLYAKYSRGYRQGAISADAAEGYNTFGPEKVDSYEAGLKATFRGAVHGFLGVTGFYNDLDNQQISAGFTAPAASGVSPADGIVNAGKSRIYGAELEATVVPFRGLTLNGSYTYLNTRLISIAPIVLQAGSVYTNAFSNAVAGQSLNNSPENKFTISGDYRLPVDERVGRISVGATYSYTSSQLGGVAAGPYQRYPSFATLNLNLNWAKVAGGPIDLALFATNVTDKTYIVYQTSTYTSTGIEGAFYGEPRMYGLKLRYNFGG